LQRLMTAFLISTCKHNAAEEQLSAALRRATIANRLFPYLRRGIAQQGHSAVAGWCH